MSWTDGYVSEINYTYGYYRELSPALLRLACLSAGIAPPPEGPLNYLELGYGQGVSINIHAAALAGEFWGTDFIPAQAGHARSLAAAARSGAVLVDDSFVDFAARSDLPEFDIIALHGTWSWISDENRRAIVDIIRRRLRVGGLVYLSYNCHPGWTPALPLRHLMVLHGELAGSPDAGIISKIDNALAFTQSVIDAGAFHFRLNTTAADRLKAIAGQDRAYLAHEYFNRDWAVMPFSDVAKWLDDAKVTFATTARLMDHVEAITLTAEFQKLLAGISHPVLRQTVRDYLLNQQFRRDIFVKGLRSLSVLDRMEALRAQSFVLTILPDDIPMTTSGTMGEVQLQEGVYRPLIALLAEDTYAPKTLGVLADHPTLNGVPFEELVAALLILATAGHVHPAQPVSKKARERCAAFNQHIWQRARSTAEITTLASPVTGSGIGVEQFHQLFLLAMHNNKKTIAEQASFAWEVLAAQGRRLVIGGQILESVEQNIAELTQHATKFVTTRLPLLKALGLA